MRKQKKTLDKSLSIRLDTETHRKLKEFAEKERRSAGQVIRLALERFLREASNGNNKA